MTISLTSSKPLNRALPVEKENEKKNQSVIFQNDVNYLPSTTFGSIVGHSDCNWRIGRMKSRHGATVAYQFATVQIDQKTSTSFGWNPFSPVFWPPAAEPIEPAIKWRGIQYNQMDETCLWARFNTEDVPRDHCWADRCAAFPARWIVWPLYGAESDSSRRISIKRQRQNRSGWSRIWRGTYKMKILINCEQVISNITPVTWLYVTWYS